MEAPANGGGGRACIEQYPQELEFELYCSHLKFSPHTFPHISLFSARESEQAMN